MLNPPLRLESHEFADHACRNMFLAAAPYFQRRFASSPWVLQNFQPSIIVSSTVVNLVGMIVLARLQRNVSYPWRIVAFLILNIVAFLLLTLFAVTFLDIDPNVYFAIVLLLVCVSAMAAALAQNGLFALSSGFGREEYTQAIMAGQGVAGVAPCIVQIVSVLSVSQRNAEHGQLGDPSKSAFAYFLTAAAISAISLLAFSYLLRHHRQLSHAKRIVEDVQSAEITAQAENKQVGLMTLFWKLKWFATSIFLAFGVSMLFPVFTQQIVSVQPADAAPRILQPATFIPLALLLWNAGDLAGRYMPLLPVFNLVQAPKATLAWSIARFAFIPLYLLCNIKGRGAVINSDFFYLVAVQFFFGLTSGWIGSTCMMAAPAWVDKDEREAAGGFMGLVLVAGLTVGSLLSFVVA